jgi:hypothetical protein
MLRWRGLCGRGRAALAHRLAGLDIVVDDGFPGTAALWTGLLRAEDALKAAVLSSVPSWNAARRASVGEPPLVFFTAGPVWRVKELLDALVVTGTLGASSPRFLIVLSPQGAAGDVPTEWRSLQDEYKEARTILSKAWGAVWSDSTRQHDAWFGEVPGTAATAWSSLECTAPVHETAPSAFLSRLGSVASPASQPLHLETLSQTAVGVVVAPADGVSEMAVLEGNPALSSPEVLRLSRAFLVREGKPRAQRGPEEVRSRALASGGVLSTDDMTLENLPPSAVTSLKAVARALGDTLVGAGMRVDPQNIVAVGKSARIVGNAVVGRIEELQEALVDVSRWAVENEVVPDSGLSAEVIAAAVWEMLTVSNSALIPRFAAYFGDHWVSLLLAASLGAFLPKPRARVLLVDRSVDDVSTVSNRISSTVDDLARVTGSKSHMLWTAGGLHNGVRQLWARERLSPHPLVRKIRECWDDPGPGLPDMSGEALASCWSCLLLLPRPEAHRALVNLLEQYFGTGTSEESLVGVFEVAARSDASHTSQGCALVSCAAALLLLEATADSTGEGPSHEWMGVAARSFACVEESLALRDALDIQRFWREQDWLDTVLEQPIRMLQQTHLACWHHAHPEVELSAELMSVCELVGPVLERSVLRVRAAVDLAMAIHGVVGPAEWMRREAAVLSEGGEVWRECGLRRIGLSEQAELHSALVDCLMGLHWPTGPTPFPWMGDDELNLLRSSQRGGAVPVLVRMWDRASGRPDREEAESRVVQAARIAVGTCVQRLMTRMREVAACRCHGEPFPRLVARRRELQRQEQAESASRRSGVTLTGLLGDVLGGSATASATSTAPQEPVDAGYGEARVSRLCGNGECNSLSFHVVCHRRGSQRVCWSR